MNTNICNATFFSSQTGINGVCELEPGHSYPMHQEKVETSESSYSWTFWATGTVSELSVSAVFAQYWVDSVGMSHLSGTTLMYGDGRIETHV